MEFVAYKENRKVTVIAGYFIDRDRWNEEKDV